MDFDNSNYDDEDMEALLFTLIGCGVLWTLFCFMTYQDKPLKFSKKK